MADTLSPEEKLFKVIQQGKRTASQDGGVREKKNGSWFQGFKHFITVPAPGNTSADGKGALLARLKWPELNPGSINKVLAVVLGVVLVLGVYAALGKRKDMAWVDAVMRTQTLPEEGKKIEPLKELSFYLNAVRKRNIFRASAGAPAVENAPKTSELLTKATEPLKLQGISWGDVPKAMILVKDDKDGKMYFLVEGQAIGTTGLKVIEISRSSVKISDGSEETVLL